MGQILHGSARTTPAGRRAIQRSQHSFQTLAKRFRVSRLLPTRDGQSPLKQKCKDYPIGYLHVDFAEMHMEEGRVYLFVAIERTSKVAFAELQPRATRMLAAIFLRRVLAASATSTALNTVAVAELRSTGSRRGDSS